MFWTFWTQWTFEIIRISDLMIFFVSTLCILFYEKMKTFASTSWNVWFLILIFNFMFSNFIRLKLRKCIRSLLHFTGGLLFTFFNFHCYSRALFLFLYVFCFLYNFCTLLYWNILKKWVQNFTFLHILALNNLDLSGRIPRKLEDNYIAVSLILPCI